MTTSYQMQTEHPENKEVSGLLALVAYGPDGDHNADCKFCYTYHFNRYHYNFGIPFHWNMFMWSPILARGGYKWLDEMKTNVANKRSEIIRDIAKAEEAFEKFERYGILSKLYTWTFVDGRNEEWMRSSLRFERGRLVEHDSLDVKRREFYNNAEKYLKHLEKTLEMRKTTVEVFHFKSNLKKLPTDVLHHHVHPAIKDVMTTQQPDFGTHYVIPETHKMHSDILAAFTSKSDNKLELSQDVKSGFCKLLKETITTYGEKARKGIDYK